MSVCPVVAKRANRVTLCFFRVMDRAFCVSELWDSELEGPADECILQEEWRASVKSFFSWLVVGVVIAAGALMPQESASEPLGASGDQSENHAVHNVDISGTWVAKLSNPMGEMEIV
jgi:hypothetical protein